MEEQQEAKEAPPKVTLAGTCPGPSSIADCPDYRYKKCTKGTKKENIPQASVGAEDAFGFVGKDCLYRHSRGALKQNVCRSWVKDATCKFGVGCRFYHPVEGSPLAAKDTRSSSTPTDAVPISKEKVNIEDQLHNYRQGRKLQLNPG